MSRYFEGWYFKHQKGPHTLAIIAGRAGDGAFVQAVTQQRAYIVRYPLSAYRKGKDLQLSKNRFGRDGLSLCIQAEDLQLSGRIDYRDLTPISGHIMGPFRFLPMQCSHSIVSMNHLLTGSVRLNGQEIDFSGGKGYIEGDAGRSFPKSYTWVQCNDFEQNCSIMASVAHIPFAFSWFWGCICVVWLDGVQYRLATYNGAKIRHRDRDRLVLAQKDLELEVTFLQRNPGHLLAAPNRGKMERSIREVPGAPAHFVFRQGRRILFHGESQLASYEHVF